MNPNNTQLLSLLHKNKTQTICSKQSTFHTKAYIFFKKYWILTKLTKLITLYNAKIIWLKTYNHSNRQININKTIINTILILTIKTRQTTIKNSIKINNKIKIMSIIPEYSYIKINIKTRLYPLFNRIWQSEYKSQKFTYNLLKNANIIKNKRNKSTYNINIILH